LIPRAAAKLAKARFTLPWAKILIPFGEIFQQRRPVRIDFLAVFFISSSLLVAAGGRTGFIVAFVTTLFIRELEWGGRVGLALFTAAMPFSAALLLGYRDMLRYRSRARQVGSRLIPLPDSTDDEFLAAKPCSNVELLLETRQAISAFFDVPSTKIGRHLRLVEDLQVEDFVPVFQASVVGTIVSSRVEEKRMFAFSMDGLKSIDDFAAAIQKALDDMEQSRPYQAQRSYGIG
jgi:hypothetical protein